MFRFRHRGGGKSDEERYVMFFSVSFGDGWSRTASRALAAATVIALGVLGTGCSASPGESDSGDEQTITVWTHEFSPLQDALNEKFIPEFEKANPGVTVKNTTIPNTGAASIDAKLSASLSSGGGPDLWENGSWNYQEFIDKGYLAPFDPTIFGFGSAKEMIDAYQPGSMSVFTRGDEIYGLFSEFNNLALFYNVDMFEEAGLEPPPSDRPVSWDEIGELARKLTKRKANGAPEQIGFQFNYFETFRDPQWATQDFYLPLRQLGQDDVFVDGEPAADTDAVRGALGLFHDFTHKYKGFDPRFPSDFFAPFANGQAAMTLAGTWFVANIEKLNPKVRFGVAPVPVIDPDDPAGRVAIEWSQAWSVNARASTEKQALAQEFIAFILGRKGETEQASFWFDQAGYVQPSRAFLESDAYEAKLDEDPWLGVFLSQLADYELSYTPHVKDEAAAAIVRAIDRVIFEDKTPDEAARQLQDELSALG